MNNRSQRSSTDISNKVSGAALAGALVTVIVTVLAAYGVQIPEGVAAAAVTLIAFGVGYLVPDSGSARS